MKIRKFNEAKEEKINADTKLKVLRDWITPYNSNMKNQVSTSENWAKKLGKDTDTFIKDFSNGSLDDWFEIKK